MRTNLFQFKCLIGGTVLASFHISCVGRRSCYSAVFRAVKAGLVRSVPFFVRASAL